jgi:glycosyltransferase involved in cell wall biosynthesis
MRIAQVVLPDASAYERKSQRADRAALSLRHDVMLVGRDEVADSGAEVVHVYGAVSYVAVPSRLPAKRRSFIGRLGFLRGNSEEPRTLLSPLGEQPLPEAVEEIWFEPQPARFAPDAKIIGSFARPEVRSMIDRTLSRIHRFRSDISWHLFEKEPAPEDLREVDAWIDPTVREDDFDGFVAEALVLGLPIVASRTPINVQRLEKGRTGFLLPVNDPNEMTHAILTALFKPEASASRQNAAKQTASKFRPRQRLRILERLYEQTIA